MMFMDYVLTPDTLAFLALPALIFLARVADVSIGTLRIIYVSRGMKYLAPLLGFFEVLIWLLAMVQIINNIDSPLHYIAYAGGFAAGTFVGMLLEEKLSVGLVIIRIITRKDTKNLRSHLTCEGYRITHHYAEGDHGKSRIIFTIINRKEIKKVIGIIRQHNPSAFYTIEDLKHASERITPIRENKAYKYLSPLRKIRKGK
jgi:uncharacterized protein YebE (UPF0316 family)